MPCAADLVARTGHVLSADRQGAAAEAAAQELAEHWTDPKDIREQRFQLAGMLVLFAVTAGIVGRQKIKIRRLIRG